MLSPATCIHTCHPPPLNNQKAAKDWGWREFVTLTSLFDLDAGFLVNDTVVFAAEVLVLKEATDVREIQGEGAGPSPLGLPEGITTGPPKNTPPRPPLLPGGGELGAPVEPSKRVQVWAWWGRVKTGGTTYMHT